MLRAQQLGGKAVPIIGNKASWNRWIRKSCRSERLSPAECRCRDAAAQRDASEPETSPRLFAIVRTIRRRVITTDVTFS